MVLASTTTSFSSFSLEESSMTTTSWQRPTILRRCRWSARASQVPSTSSLQSTMSWLTLHRSAFCWGMRDHQPKWASLKSWQCGSVILMGFRATSLWKSSRDYHLSTLMAMESQTFLKSLLSQTQAKTSRNSKAITTELWELSSRKSTKVFSLTKMVLTIFTSQSTVIMETIVWKTQEIPTSSSDRTFKCSESLC